MQELEKLQVVELRALLEHAGTKVPYWRELFRRVGFDPRAVESRADLSALPVTTRETVQEHFSEMLDPTSRGPHVRKGTSGTTGVPLKFEYCNASETWRQAVRLRGYGWAGYRMGEPTLHYWGTGTTLPKGLAAAKVRLDRALRREVYIDAIMQDEASLWYAARRIAQLRPHVIIGYAQALASFARWAIDRGARDWADSNIICAAEPLSSADREALRRAFGANVFDTYGSRETMLLGAECDRHDGLHLSEENLVVEIARDGRLVPDGESGDVVVTDLHNYRMPFIRYANGDLAVMDGSKTCACGRGLRRLGAIEGRRADTLRDANGEAVSGMLFVSLMQSADELVREYQVLQRTNGALELRVVKGRDFDQPTFEEIARRCAAYFKGLPFNVVYCDAIEKSSTGKRRPIVIEGQPMFR
jgi:phenylacetate-CoA ligase